MSAAVRRAWWRIWIADLERGIPGPWDPELSLAIDRARVVIEDLVA